MAIGRSWKGQAMRLWADLARTAGIAVDRVAEGDVSSSDLTSPHEPCRREKR